ncbi:MAG: DUF927 domain-containing protein [Methylocella sp.]
MTTINRKNTIASGEKILGKKIAYMASNIAILGEGKNKHGHRFTKLGFKGPAKPVLVSHNKLVSNANLVYTQLTAQGARLITLAAQRELRDNIQNYKPSTPLFKVAEEIGLFDDCFILPDGTIPPKPKGVEVYLSDIPRDIISKYECAGTLEGWQELAKYAVGNTRMMFAFALNFVGPVSAIWPRQSVAFQLTAEASSGKSTIAAVSTSAWGWDPDPNLGNKYGFGTSWNITVNKLEAICKGYNHTILFLDETGVAERNAKNRSADILQAIMRLDSQKEKGRMTDEGPGGVWILPVLSTSNVSVVQMVKLGAPGTDPRIYTDRFFDIPAPDGGNGMFEDLYGFHDNGEFSIHLKQLASQNQAMSRLMLKSAKRASLIENLRSLRGLGKMRVR